MKHPSGSVMNYVFIAFKCTVAVFFPSSTPWAALCARYYVNRTRFVTREFKKLRRQLRGKRHIKIELCVKSLANSMLITSYKIGRVHFRLFGTNGFHVKAKNEPLKYENFTSSFGRPRQNIAPKSVLHVQHDYFSSFNQSNH